jgi:hypothetical protein
MSGESPPKGASADARNVESDSTATGGQGAQLTAKQWGRFCRMTVAGILAAPAETSQAIALAMAIGKGMRADGTFTTPLPGEKPVCVELRASHRNKVIELLGLTSRTWRRYLALWEQSGMAHRCDDLKRGGVRLFLEPVSVCPAPTCKRTFVTAKADTGDRISGHTWPRIVPDTGTARGLQKGLEALEVEEEVEEGSQERRVAKLNDDEVRALGYEPTRKGWVPITDEARTDLHDVAERLEEVRARSRAKTVVIPGPSEPCIVCGDPAEPSLVHTPTCSGVCLGKLADFMLPAIAPKLATQVDGSGGREQVQIPEKPKRLRVIPDGAPSVEAALGRLGSPRTVLERHGVRIRGRMVFCPFHENTRTPAMSIYGRAGKEYVHCHGCGFDGDALDIEAALAGEDLKTTIRRWT